MQKKLNALKFLFAGFGLLLSTTSIAAVVDTNIDNNDVAIKGYDPVAYFTAAEPTVGKSEYTANHNGAIYRFASEKNRDLFRANPEKYAPQYGGFCAYGVTLNRKLTIDPEAWAVVDDKLYLNLNKKVAKTWSKDIPAYIATADDIWPEIKGSTYQFLESVAN